MKTCSAPVARLDAERGADRGPSADSAASRLGDRAAGCSAMPRRVAACAAPRRARCGSGPRGANGSRRTDVRVVVLGRRPGQRVERQAKAHRRVAGDQEQLLAAEEPPAARPSGAGSGDCRTLQRQGVADDARPGPCSKTRASARARSSGPRACSQRIDVDRQPPLRPQVVPDVLVGRDGRCRRSTPSRSASALDEAPAPRVVAVAVVGRLVARSRSGRARPARRRAASSSRAPSAAATRRDTTCPGRSAAGRPGAKRSRSRRDQVAGQRALGRAERPRVFHSAPSRSSIDTNVGSPPIVRRTSPAVELVIDALAERVDRLPLLLACTAS